MTRPLDKFGFCVRIEDVTLRDILAKGQTDRRLKPLLTS